MFRSLIAQPAYGANRVILTWSVTAGYEDGDFYIYRSPTGIAQSDDWELLNPDDPVSNVDFYTDSTLTDKKKFRDYFYRVLLEKGDESFDSPIIGMFCEELRKSEYGALYTIRRLEYLRMRSGNGNRIFHAIPTITGEHTGTYDARLGKDLVRCADNGSYGTGYVQGFSNLVQSWAEMLQAGPEELKQDPNGSGFTEEQKFKFRLLAFPHPEVGHILIFPKTDRRFIITGGIQPFLFKGFLPVAYEVECSFLEKEDPRYQLPNPELLADPDYPVLFTRAL